MNFALQILKSTLSCVTYSGDQHTNIKIKETDPGAKLKTVNIVAPNGDWFVFAPDKGRGRPPLMSPLLATKGSHDHHRACDAVIVVLQEAILRLIFVDLKSNSVTGYTGQFRSTRQFALYLLGLLKEFHNISFQVEEQFVVFHTSAKRKIFLDKKPTLFMSKSGPSSDPAKPQKEVVGDGVTVYLKQLLN